jgi:hypothetical protein
MFEILAACHINQMRELQKRKTLELSKLQTATLLQPLSRLALLVVAIAMLAHVH